MNDGISRCQALAAAFADKACFADYISAFSRLLAKWTKEGQWECCGLTHRVGLDVGDDADPWMRPHQQHGFRLLVLQQHTPFSHASGPGHACLNMWVWCVWSSFFLARCEFLPKLMYVRSEKKIIMLADLKFSERRGFWFFLLIGHMHLCEQEQSRVKRLS